MRYEWRISLADTDAASGPSMLGVDWHAAPAPSNAWATEAALKWMIEEEEKSAKTEKNHGRVFTRLELDQPNQIDLTN
jgi:hypothetical protein